MKKLLMLVLSGIVVMAISGFIFTSCTKEGPQGPAGAAGTNGKDAATTCTQCHAKAVVDEIATEFELSKHAWGTAAFEEAGNPGCDPCHTQKGYVFVCTNNTPTAFTFDATSKKWVNPYATDDANALGAISCFTCHTNLHTTYGQADLALTTKAPVPMTMWGGAKTIDVVADSGMGNLCAKCHQPRPLTCGYDPAGRLLNYDSLKNFPKEIQFDSTAGAKNHGVKPSYRMHVHYGVVGAVFAGVGAIEFSGSRTYTNSKHSSVADCQDCHMALPMTGIAGGHAFNVRNAKESALGSGTTWNFAGCNVAGCHDQDPLSATHAKFKDTRAEIKGLLDALATKINSVGGGHNILHSDATSSNLWAGISTGNFDGYLDIYDASSNPGGYWRMDNKQPKFPSLLNVQVGALINFQFCLREYSLGIHNTQYVKALLINTVEALNAAGV